MKTDRRRAREFALREWSYAATTRALAEWAVAPALAPDNAARAHQTEDELAAISLNDVERFMARPADLDLDRLLQDSAGLHALRQKPLFRAWKSIKRLLGGR